MRLFAFCVRDFENPIPSVPLLSQFKTRVTAFFSVVKETVKTNYHVYIKSDEQPRVQKPLKVTELLPSEKEELSKTISAWRAFAKAKEAQSSLLLPNFFLDHLSFPFYSRRYDIFSSSFNICDSIHHSLVNKDKLKLPHLVEKIFICSLDQPDTQDPIQAVALISEVRRANETPYMCIGYIASRPQNLVSPLNKDQPSRIEGAALALIKHLAEKVCPASNLQSVHLIPGCTSKEFYKKCGFREEWPEMILDL